MISKGVASVRSDVQNLRYFNDKVSHDRFVMAAVESFQKEYGLAEEVRV